MQHITDSAAATLTAIEVTTRGRKQNKPTSPKLKTAIWLWINKARVWIQSILNCWLCKNPKLRYVTQKQVQVGDIIIIQYNTPPRAQRFREYQLIGRRTQEENTRELIFETSNSCYKNDIFKKRKEIKGGNSWGMWKVVEKRSKIPINHVSLFPFFS